MPTKFLNIDKSLGAPLKDRIYRVGIELEGGWSKIPDGTSIDHDGSVRILTPTDPVKGRVPIVTGEIVSKPLELDKFPEWMKQMYPQHVNDSCGLHVHMSFKKAWYYQLLMVPQYQATMLEYLGRWAEKEKLEKKHHIWGRLSGQNEFCRTNFFADMQASQTKKSYNRENPEGHRYTAINYCHGLHETLECRVLPMMDTVDQSIRAVRQVLDITNASLRTLAAKEEKLKASIVLRRERSSMESKERKRRVKSEDSDDGLREELEVFID